MKLHPVIMRNSYTKLKYIVGTQYVLFDAGLCKSSNSKHTLSEIWRKGLRVKINETM